MKNLKFALIGFFAIAVAVSLAHADENSVAQEIQEMQSFVRMGNPNAVFTNESMNGSSNDNEQDFVNRFAQHALAGDRSGVELHSTGSGNGGNVLALDFVERARGFIPTTCNLNNAHIFSVSFPLCAGASHSSSDVNLAPVTGCSESRAQIVKVHADLLLILVNESLWRQQSAQVQNRLAASALQTALAGTPGCSVEGAAR